MSGFSSLFQKEEHIQERKYLPIEELMQIFSSRARKITEHCKSIENSKVKKQKTDLSLVKEIKIKYETMGHEKQIIIMPEKSLLWCIVPKVASSSVVNAIAVENNLTAIGVENNFTAPEIVSKLLHLEVKNFYSKRTVEMNDLSTKFVSFHITRHPFERIVSAYRDKLENSSVHDGDFFYNTYGLQIVNLYRDFSHGNESDHIRKEPTFNEFVRYLSNTERSSFDKHWKPISLLCNVCLFPYDFILKLENFGKEHPALVKYLIQNNHVSSKFLIKWDNKRTDTSIRDEITKKYMKKLPKIYIWNLYNVYKEDFDYYDYDIQEYL